MADPTIEAARGVIDSSLDSLRAVVVGSSTDVLNQRPAGDDTNPIAADCRSLLGTEAALDGGRCERIRETASV